MISNLLDRQPVGYVSNRSKLTQQYTACLILLSVRPRLPSQLESVTALGRYQLMLLENKTKDIQAKEMRSVEALALFYV